MKKIIFITLVISIASLSMNIIQYNENIQINEGRESYKAYFNEAVMYVDKSMNQTKTMIRKYDGLKHKLDSITGK